MATEASHTTEAPTGGMTARPNTTDVGRQPLTIPTEPVGNGGWDNEQNDLILSTHDVLHDEINSSSYLVLGKLGQGTFGQVVRCWSHFHRSLVAVKVIKNQPAYHQQAMVEVKLLQALNRDYEADRHNFIRFYDYFRFRNHLCLVFELLQRNLFELIRVGGYRGFSLGLVRHFIKQVLQTLLVLRQERMIHGDLKPENVLLEDERSGLVKVIDFGSACMEHETVYSYIQSRFYRSPEVVLAYPYDSAIDIWSLGCIAAELYLGLPLFPAASERDLLARMIEVLGPFPPRMLEMSRRLRRYFKERVDAAEKYELMTEEEFDAHNREAAPTARKYFTHTRLEEIVVNCKARSSSAPPEDPSCFLDFLQGILQMDPGRRWNAEQAAEHPFLTGVPFTVPFYPPMTAPRQRSRPVGIGSMPYGQHHSASWHPHPTAHSIAHEAAMLAVSQLTNSVTSNSSHLAAGQGSAVTHPVSSSFTNTAMPAVSPEVNPSIMMAAMRAAHEAFSNPSCPSTFQSVSQPGTSTSNRRINGFHVTPRPSLPSETPPNTFNTNRHGRPMADISENNPVMASDRELSFDLDHQQPSALPSMRHHTINGAGTDHGNHPQYIP